MSTRIRNHLRNNVVGYIALFLVLTGGTAQALNGSNTVFSDDIVNGEVKNADIGTSEVKANNVAPDSLGSAKIADHSVKNADLSLGASSSNTIADGGIQNVDLGRDAVTSDKIQDGGVQNVDLGPDAVTSDKIQDGQVNASDISSAPPFGSGGFNGDQKIQDGSIIGFFDIAPNTVSEGQIDDGYLSAGSGTDGACFDDDSNGEVCASTTFTLETAGKVLLNATGQWRTFSSPPDSMACQLQADGAVVGLTQSFGENGSNHTGTQADGTMALTGLTGTLSAGTHTFRTFCTTTDADIDLLNNQITAARVDQ
jgi:hypothetical protein